MFVAKILPNVPKLTTINSLIVNITNPEEIASRIKFTTDLKPLGSDQNMLIIEAISEVLEWKQDLFRQLTYCFCEHSYLYYLS